MGVGGCTLLSPVCDGIAGDWRDTLRERPRCDPLKTVGMLLEPWRSVLVQAIRRLVGVICLRELQTQRPPWPTIAPAQRRQCPPTRDTPHRLLRATRHDVVIRVAELTTPGTNTCTVCPSHHLPLHSTRDHRSYLVSCSRLLIFFKPPSLALMLEPLFVLLVIRFDACSTFVLPSQPQLHRLHLVLEADELAVDHRAFGDGGADRAQQGRNEPYDRPVAIARPEALRPNSNAGTEMERAETGSSIAENTSATSAKTRNLTGENLTTDADLSSLPNEA
jgi:hypothetical protein